MGKTSTAVKRRYNEKTYDYIHLAIYKGEKEAIKAHVEKYDGGSVSSFIKRAIKETMERDKATRKVIERPDGAEN